ncbi:MAG: PHP domain-containing protein [Thermoplasmatota archaeon]
MRYDLHVHTQYSKDCAVPPVEMARHLKKQGYAGMAITDHDTAAGALKSYDISGFLIVPGIEVSTTQGHLLGLGISADVASRDAATAIDEIHAQGGIAVIPHPFRRSSPSIASVEGLDVDAVETFNGRNFPRQNRQAAALAAEYGLPVTGGSDAHQLWEAGSGYTIAEARTVDDLLADITSGKTRADGTTSLRRPIRSALGTFRRYMDRGFGRV